MIYLKKDIILGSAPFCYLWFIDDYVFGASMFDFMKVDKYGTDAVSMKSDFVIDHPLQKLSKLLIMGFSQPNTATSCASASKRR